MTDAIGNPWPAASLVALPNRLAELIHVEPTGDCWLWTKTVNSAGYGTVTYTLPVNGRRKHSPWLTHRLVWELLVGPIKPGDELHHWCHTPPCCNPVHCEPMTAVDHHNAHIGMRETCSAGHLWTTENTWIRSTGARACRACRAAAARRRYRTDPARFIAERAERRARSRR